MDVPSICFVIHVGPPRSMREYMQETGGAGRDGKPSTVILYYNNRAIATNRTEISDDIRSYCCLEKACLRKFLLKCLNVKLMKIHWVTVVLIANAIANVRVV